MKRLHVHVSVEDLDRSVAFYSALFAAEPTRLEDDYAKWRIDDPRINFAISTRRAKAGLEHLGIEVDEEGELEEVFGRLEAAGGAVVEEGHTVCCYAKSEKSWIQDPASIPWEVFRTYGGSAIYGDGINDQSARLFSNAPGADAGLKPPAAAGDCCGTKERGEAEPCCS
ncbi:MAG: ArsI/CadI family heavy metal resistance metalloenzyme [Pseudomonadota bacterium]